jgi:hypothetical protein
MAQNDSVLADQDGDYSDWMELYNASASPVNLDGLFLTDNAANLTKWRLPAQSLPAGGYLVVFASGKNRAVPGVQLHTSFSLDANGEFLALVATNGTTILSSFGAKFSKQYADISYGHQTQGTNLTLRAGQPGYLVSHTPGGANVVFPAPHPVYSDTSLARIEIICSQATWDILQAASPTSDETAVNVRFRHGDIDVTVTNVGISLRGNTSFSKYPRSFNVSFNSYVPGQNLFGIEKLNLNSEVNDPSTERSKLCFDLHQAAGLAAPYASHVATVISGPNNHRSGPDSYFFDAVLNNTQPVDDVFIQQRFTNTRGNLYKCTYTGAPANLLYLGPTGSSYAGQARYELKYSGNGDTSFNDLADFINVLNNTPSNAFPSVIRKHFEVDDFLKRLALDVLTSNWDSYWGNYNNFHLYRDPGSGRWHYLPYDMDNTFSIRWISPPSGNWATQNIYTWGKSSDVPLVSRILGVPEFRNRYSHYMNQLLLSNYTSAKLNAPVYRTRTNQTAALPFGGLGVTNCKSSERARYGGDWPNWTYTQYSNSFDFAQVTANNRVPNYHGITEFIIARRTNALNQLQLSNIAPILSALTLCPTLPATNQFITFAIRAEDNVSVSAVKLVSSFNGGTSVTNSMTDNGTGGDAASGDKVFTAQLGPFAVSGTLVYHVQATDNTGRVTFEPWGGPADAASLVIGSPFLGLAVSEINYHPHDPSGGELAVNADADAYEFIELQNMGSASLNLGGVKFIAGISFTFPPQVLSPGARVVIAKNAAAFAARYGAGVSIAGVFDGQLSNGGEALHLADTNGATIKLFTYQDTAPWPQRADGHGSALELVDAAGDYNSPFNWCDSIRHGGSPGTNGLLPPPGIVINEVLSHTDLPLVDSIELHNPTASAINIGGWYLSDSDSAYKKFRIPGGAVLAAGGYVTFDESHFNSSGGLNTNDFRLDAAHGDDVWLLQADAQSNLVAFVDHVSFGAARNGESFGCWRNGTGELYPMVSRSFNMPNPGPRVGPVIISECMYQPASGSNAFEFIEILNTGVAAENLTNWKLSGDVDYAFPSNTVLAAGQALAVLAFDPAQATNATLRAAFLVHYGIGTNVALAGGFLGSLPNSGGGIRLMRPDDPPATEPAFIPLLLEDEVRYTPTFPWPTIAAGGGPALTRRGPASWGNDALSWIASVLSPATPGLGPLADRDGDGLPDSYEFETYGGTNVVGTVADTDHDGVGDLAEYIAGTSATNATDLFKLTASRLPEGNVAVQFESRLADSAGYFGLARRYALDESTNVGNGGAWMPVVGFTEILPTGSWITQTNFTTNAPKSLRGRVWLK